MAAGDPAFRVSTRRNALLFLCAFCLTVGPGIGSRAVVVAGEFALVLLVLQWRAGARVLGPLRVERRHHPRAFEGATVGVELTIANDAPAPARLVEARDTFPPGGDYQVRALAAEVPGEADAHFCFRHVCTRRRGLYLLGPVGLHATDDLGLFDFRETRDVLGTLTVYPSSVGLAGFEPLGRGTQFHVGEQVVRALGRSEEFASVREYRRGDPPRFIHWRSTARMGRPFVKEFDRNVVTEITLMCDLFIVALAGLGNLTTVEYRVKVAASIAAEATRHHHRVRIVAVKDPPQETPMGGGRRHLLALLDWLALVKAEGRGSFEEQVEAAAVRLRPGATAVLVMSSVHVEPGRLARVLRLLRLRRVRAISVVVDDRTFLKLRTEQDRAFADAPALEDLVRMMRNEGATVFTVALRDDLTQVLGVPG